MATGPPAQWGPTAAPAAAHGGDTGPHSGVLSSTVLPGRPRGDLPSHPRGKRQREEKTH